MPICLVGLRSTNLSDRSVGRVIFRTASSSSQLNPRKLKINQVWLPCRTRMNRVPELWVPSCLLQGPLHQTHWWVLSILKSLCGAETKANKTWLLAHCKLSSFDRVHFALLDLYFTHIYTTILAKMKSYHWALQKNLTPVWLAEIFSMSKRSMCPWNHWAHRKGKQSMRRVKTFAVGPVILWNTSNLICGSATVLSKYNISSDSTLPPFILSFFIYSSIRNGSPTPTTTNIIKRTNSIQINCYPTLTPTSSWLGGTRYHILLY